jgi:hypothetical protein
MWVEACDKEEEAREGTEASNPEAGGHTREEAKAAAAAAAVRTVPAYVTPKSGPTSYTTSLRPASRRQLSCAAPATPFARMSTHMHRRVDVGAMPGVDWQVGRWAKGWYRG